MLTLLVLSLALSVDGFAFAFALAMQKRTISSFRHISIAGCFAFFQFTMPILGWVLGSIIQDFINVYTNWIAFFLLLFTGLRMILGQVDWKVFYRCLIPTKIKTTLLNRKVQQTEQRILSFYSPIFPFSSAYSDKAVMQRIPRISFSSLLILGIVTSIDALTIGVSYGILQKNIFFPACVISLVTFFITLFGAYCGLILGKNIFIAKFSTIIGGMIIIGVAISSIF